MCTILCGFATKCVGMLLAAVMSVGSICGSFFSAVPLAEYFKKLSEDFCIKAQAVASDPVEAVSRVVYEVGTGSYIYCENENEIVPAGHFAKLMTLLLVQEAVERDELSYAGTTKVSAHANSMQGAQIWLDVGEEITIEELIKSVTVGNANDACVALAEAEAGSESAFVEKMNVRAGELGMSDSYFADCTGVDPATVTSARDIALLCGELSGHKELFPYMTTWLDTVRNGKAQLVNTNRLVRSYKGIIGMKSCPDGSLAAAAKRGDMTVVAVIIGCKDDDERFSWAKDAMNKAFAAYEVCIPALPEEAVSDVQIINGASTMCRVRLKEEKPLLIPKGSSDRLQIAFERVETLAAPVTKDTIIGTLSVTLDGEELLRTDIVLAGSVDKLSYTEAFKRLLFDLLKM